MTAKEIENYIRTLLEDGFYADEDNEDEDFDIESYESAGVMTMDKGLVLYLPDGIEVHLTIQAYNNGLIS